MSSHKPSLLPDDPNSTEASNREHQCSCTFTFLANQESKGQSFFCTLGSKRTDPFSLLHWDPLSGVLGEFSTHSDFQNKEHNSGRKPQVTAYISAGRLQICSLINPSGTA